MTSVRYDPQKHPTLRRGMRGDAVMRMQRHLVGKLSDLNAESFADGVFGPGTQFQVKRFQRSAGLVSDGVVGRNSWTALLRSEANASAVAAPASSADKAEQVKTQGQSGDLAARVRRAVEAKGYTWFDDGQPYALNIVGVRSASDRINTFDDTIYVVYRDDECCERVLKASITTDPGHHYTRVKLLNSAGAAILVPGQYLRTYDIGRHRGTYEALVQRAKVRVWRDGNMDDKLDRGGRVHEGWFGINIHRANSRGTTAKVGRYSAGCQVFQDADAFKAFMTIAKKSHARRKEKLTYTLLTAEDF